MSGEAGSNRVFSHGRGGAGTFFVFETAPIIPTSSHIAEEISRQQITQATLEKTATVLQHEKNS
jgi:hypothetical protein